MAFLYMFVAVSVVSMVAGRSADKCTPKFNQMTDSEMFTQYAKCVFQENIEGAIFIREADFGTEIRLKIRGLDEGYHGFHVHEFGDLLQTNNSIGRCELAGSHFNPTDEMHGAHGSDERHIGDLGNVCVDHKGESSDVIFDEHLLLTGSHSIVGYAMVVHEDPDDYETQPTGNAGGRLGCCVIGISDEWEPEDVQFGYLDK